MGLGNPTKEDREDNMESFRPYDPQFPPATPSAFLSLAVAKRRHVRLVKGNFTCHETRAILKNVTSYLKGGRRRHAELQECTGICLPVTG